VSSCYRLIDAEKANYPVSLLCKVLKVEERLLRLEGPSALQEGHGERHPHREDQGDPPQEQSDLRLP
jgi:hypothetical protein